MSTTTFTNYKETLQNSTVDVIEELLLDNYCLDSILEFIDQYDEQKFIDHYETYVALGEQYSYEAVDAFIDYYEDLTLLEKFKDAYMGCYETVEEFSKEYYNENYFIPSHFYMDWSKTWEYNLSIDHIMISNFIFNKNF